MANDGERDRPTGLTRRTFITNAAAAGLATGLLPAAGAQVPAPAAGEAPPRSEHGVPILGPGPVPLRLTVNGRSYALQLEPRTTLLDALRDRLDLTGSKRVCDQGTCGACTVLLGGEPVYACSVLAIEAQEAAITTVEGLGTPDKMHPLQAAFVRHDAQQCGFCTPGFVVAAKALLDRHPAPTPDQVVEGLSGNFCRCGTYAGIRQAVGEGGKVV